ncbi:hypothetical protein TYRP_010981 [Tyrophagus putrescentiae]|nr:hypothetical protein TYRP_010981 [Tyrophagus putrescentiae]
MYFKIFWFILACYYLAFLFIASTVGRCCRRMQSAVKSLLGLFTNTSASVWKTVVQPLANMALLSSDSCTTTAAAGSLLGAKSKEEEEEEESSHPCLMKITRTDQRGKKVQTSNHSGNEHSGSGVDEVDQPKMQNQQQQITQGVDMELLLKSLAITLQTMLHNALRRREHIIDRQSGRLLPVPLSLGPVGREPVSLVLRHHLAKI